MSGIGYTEINGMSERAELHLTYTTPQFKTLQQISDTLVSGLSCLPIRLALTPRRCMKVDPDTAAEEKEAAVRLTEPKTAERLMVNRVKERKILIETASATFATMERQIATAQAHARYVGIVQRPGLSLQTLIK